MARDKSDPLWLPYRGIEKAFTGVSKAAVQRHKVCLSPKKPKEPEPAPQPEDTSWIHVGTTGDKLKHLLSIAVGIAQTDKGGQNRVLAVREAHALMMSLNTIEKPAEDTSSTQAAEAENLRTLKTKLDALAPAKTPIVAPPEPEEEEVMGPLAPAAVAHSTGETTPLSSIH